MSSVIMKHSIKQLPYVNNDRKSITPGTIVMVTGELCIFTGFVSRTRGGRYEIVAQVVCPNGTIAEHPIYLIKGDCNDKN